MNPHYTAAELSCQCQDSKALSFYHGCGFPDNGVLWVKLVLCNKKKAFITFLKVFMLMLYSHFIKNPQEYGCVVSYI